MIATKCLKLLRQLRWIATLSVLYSVSAFAQAPISASFEIESELFESVLPAEQLVSTKRQVTDSLIATSARHFGFLDWQASATTGDNGDGQISQTQLIVTLRNSVNEMCTPAVDLHWSAIIKGNEIQLDKMVQDSLYAACSADIPLFENERLVAHIGEAIAQAMHNQANRKYLNEQILAHISIADRLDNHDNIMLLLPVNSSKLKAARESQLQARFMFNRQASEPVPGILELRPHAEFQDAVSLKVFQIEVPSVSATINEDGEFFPTVMPQLLENAIDFGIFMINYQPSTDVGEVIPESNVLSEL